MFSDKNMEGSAREEAARQDGVDRIVHRPVECPLQNREGQRICRDCEELILLERRIAAPNAVRCVPCQQLHEGRAQGCVR